MRTDSTPTNAFVTHTFLGLDSHTLYQAVCYFSEINECQDHYTLNRLLENKGKRDRVRILV